MKDLLTSEFSLHLREMARRKRLIAAVALLVGVLVVVVGSARDQVYASTTTVRISLTATQADDGTLTEFQSRSLAQLVPGDSFLTDVPRESGDRRSVRSVREAIAVDPQETPGFLELTATGPTAQASTRLANAVARVLDQRAGSDPSAKAAGVEVTVVEAATIGRAEPTITLGGTLSQGIAAALLAAIVVGESLVALRLARGRFSPVAPAVEVHRLLGAPVLDLRPGVGGADLFPFFHAHLGDRPLLTVLDVAEDESLDIVRRIAKLSGDTHRRVLLIDGDTGHPTLHRALGRERNAGAVELVEGLRSFRSVLEPAGHDIDAYVLQVGRVRPGSPSGLQLLAGIRESLADIDTDQVIVSASRSSSVDELVLLAHTFPEGVVLALDPAVHTSRFVRDLTDRLHRVDAVVVACILTSRQHPRRTSARGALDRLRSRIS